MNRRRSLCWAISLGIASTIGIPVAQAGTAFSVVYTDKTTSTGFYDPGLRDPVGGNPGRTLGEQRRIVFERALSLWTDVVSSSIPITVEASMKPLPCDANVAVLGQASPSSAVSLRLRTAARGVTYPIALANAIQGTDLEPPSADNPSGAEIIAEFNSSYGDPACLDGSGFYLGLDGNPNGNEADLLAVVLHELGHGFGFMSFLDFGTAEPLSPDADDAFSIHAFDLDRQAAWNALTQAQLLTSMKNARRLVWSGQHVAAASARYLVKGAPRITVNPPLSGLTGLLAEHNQGPKLADHPVTGPLVVPSPATGCSRPSNAASVKGAVALVDPGTSCHILEATGVMQAFGAVAVLSADPTASRPPAGPVGMLEDQTIPVVAIGRDDARLLATGAIGRTIALDGDSSQLVGADVQGRVYLNATDPAVEGTSVSHWDPLARNQLLMEPEESAAHVGVDLTREFLWDLGWDICGDGTVQGTEECDDGNLADNDGCSAACRKNSSPVGGGTPSSGSIGSNLNGYAGGASSGFNFAPGTGDESANGCNCRLRRSRAGLRELAGIWLLLLGRRIASRVRRNREAVLR